MSILSSFLLPAFVVNSKIYYLFLTRAKDKLNEAVAHGLFSRQEMDLDIF